MSLPIILALAFFGSIFLIWMAIRMGTSTIKAGSRQMAGEIESSLADAFVFVNQQKMAAWSMLAIIGLPVIVFLLSHSILIALASVPLAMMLPKKYLARMRKKRIEAVEKQLPDILELEDGLHSIVAAIRARRPYVAFPWRTALRLRVLGMLPRGWQDRIVAGMSKTPRS